MLPGDANGDGLVGTADYSIWAAQFGVSSGSLLPGDFDANAAVGAGDYVIWAASFNGTLPAGFPRTPVLLPGDANLDGKVGAADYAIWAAQFGQQGEGLAGDFDGSGDVGAADYALWAANFGRSAGGNSAVARPSSSPPLRAAQPNDLRRASDLIHRTDGATGRKFDRAWRRSTAAIDQVLQTATLW